MGSRWAGRRRAAVAHAWSPERLAHRLRLDRRAGGARRACPPLRRAPRGGVAGRQAAGRFRRAGRGRRDRRRRPRGGRARDDDHGGRQPGVAHARRPYAGLGRPHRDRARPGSSAARHPLAGGAAPLRRRRGLRGAQARDGHPHRRRRDGADRARGARPHPARRSRRHPVRRRAGGRDRGLPPHLGARRRQRQLLVAAHVVARPRAARKPARGARGLVLPVSRGAVRPAGLDAASGATSRSPTPSRCRPARSRRPPGPGSASSPTSTRSSDGGWHERASRPHRLRPRLPRRRGRGPRGPPGRARARGGGADGRGLGGRARGGARERAGVRPHDRRRGAQARLDGPPASSSDLEPGCSCRAIASGRGSSPLPTSCGPRSCGW